MKLILNYTINIGNMEFIKPQLEADLQDDNYGSFEAMSEHLFSIMDGWHKKYSVTNQERGTSGSPPPRLASPAQLKLLGELVDITHMHDEVGDMEKLTSVQASKYIDRLKKIANNRQEGAKEERKAAPQEPRK